jgi:hypothetical protein
MAGLRSLLRCGQCDIRCQEADRGILEYIAVQSGRGMDVIEACPRDAAGDPLENGVSPNTFPSLAISRHS